MPVVSQLLNPVQRETLMAGVKQEYDAMRARHAAKATERPLVSLEAARANAQVVDFTATPPSMPKRTGAPSSSAMASLWRGQRCARMISVGGGASGVSQRPSAITMATRYSANAGGPTGSPSSTKST